jgi:tRNA threonylcarbamoyl adenosine modification protein YeaZ
MTCLAFEFTSDRRSVGVSRDGRVLAESVHEGTRQTPVFDLIQRALSAAGVDRTAVDRLAVSLGPGSYTGIRISISAAQGWHLATGAPVVAVDTFEALRLGAENLDRSLPWTFAVDAQRDQFAVRVWNGGAWDGPVRLVEASALLESVQTGSTVLGPDLGRWIRSQPTTSPNLEALAHSVDLSPTATDVLSLAAGLPAVPPETLGPVYLREVSFVKAAPIRPFPEPHR